MIMGVGGMDALFSTTQTQDGRDRSGGAGDHAKCPSPWHQSGNVLIWCSDIGVMDGRLPVPSDSLQVLENKYKFWRYNNPVGRRQLEGLSQNQLDIWQAPPKLAVTMFFLHVLDRLYCSRVYFEEAGRKRPAAG